MCAIVGRQAGVFAYRRVFVKYLVLPEGIHGEKKKLCVRCYVIVHSVKRVKGGVGGKWGPKLKF